MFIATGISLTEGSGVPLQSESELTPIPSVLASCFVQLRSTSSERLTVPVRAFTITQGVARYDMSPVLFRGASLNPDDYPEKITPESYDSPEWPRGDRPVLVVCAPDGLALREHAKITAYLWGVHVRRRRVWAEGDAKRIGLPGGKKMMMIPPLVDLADRWDGPPQLSPEEMWAESEASFAEAMTRYGNLQSWTRSGKALPTDRALYELVAEGRAEEALRRMKSEPGVVRNPGIFHNWP